MAFRILDQSPQFFNAAGSALLVGGSVTFYASGTMTLLNTFTDPSLSTPNNNPLVINSQGRISDVWGNSNYRMIVADSLGAIQWTMDNVQGPAVLPSQAGNAGDFLSTDGTNLLWAAIAQIPSVTGQTGKMLVNDGTAAYWAAQPVLPPSTNPAITPTNTASGKIVIGPITIQWGSGTLPASGSNYTNVNVTFGTAFTGLPYHVGMGMNSGAGAMSGGGLLMLSAIARTAAGFNAVGGTNLGFVSGGPFPIVSTVAFTWLAIGPT